MLFMVCAEIQRLFLPHIDSGGLSWQGLGAGLGSQPETGLGHRGENTGSQPPDQWSVTRPLALRLCRKEFHKEGK